MPNVDSLRTLLTFAAFENEIISFIISSLLPMTILRYFLPNLVIEPEASNEPTRVPLQRNSTKSFSLLVFSKVILSFTVFTKITGISGISLKNLIHAKSSAHERNSAITKSTFFTEKISIALERSSLSYTIPGFTKSMVPSKLPSIAFTTDLFLSS
ncbi:hypothetical protein SDC9_163016 [bioreactor metagenome]|uniref:Uncharacterized protein n=1 Tax=bioreactor metagenome TaxID=1076179 RepID=A0A645FQ12_9ZZZZ